ncbi:MAG TPA: hypothetical protein VGS11_06545 [Candidatus Bathyarchaeia archaeon]|nr:hypothetical protein [Candidatus Bathyarchaeia archaeon]
MAKKRRVVPPRTKKAGKKAKSKPVKAGHVRKRAEAKKPPAVTRQTTQQPVTIEPPARERVVVTIESIRGDTAIGDLLVTFPRTREVLVRNGLRLEAEDAGDIYMTLDAFSAMNGLKTEGLVVEIVEVAKEPLPQPAAAQLVTAPAV